MRAMDAMEDRWPSPLQEDAGLSGVRLDLLLANLPGMAYRCLNRLDWCMVFVSEGCLELTGYTASQLLGTSPPTYADLIHPEDQQYVWDRVQEAVEQSRRFEMEYRIRTIDGTVKWVWERGILAMSPSNDEPMLEGFITDISDRRRMTENLTARGEQLQDELTGKIRDLRALVNAMAGREIRMAELKRENERLRRLLRDHGVELGKSEDHLQ